MRITRAEHKLDQIHNFLQRIERRMTDLSALQAAVAKTVSTIEAAVTTIREDVAALAVAHADNDGPAVAELVAKLSASTESLGIAVASSNPAPVVAEPVIEPAPVAVEPAPVAPEAPVAQ